MRASCRCRDIITLDGSVFKSRHSHTIPFYRALDEDSWNFCDILILIGIWYHLDVGNHNSHVRMPKYFSLIKTSTCCSEEPGARHPDHPDWRAENPEGTREKWNDVIRNRSGWEMLASTRSLGNEKFLFHEGGCLESCILILTPGVWSVTNSLHSHETFYNLQFIRYLSHSETLLSNFEICIAGQGLVWSIS